MQSVLPTLTLKDIACRIWSTSKRLKVFQAILAVLTAIVYLAHANAETKVCAKEWLDLERANRVRIA